MDKYINVKAAGFESDAFDDDQEEETREVSVSFACEECDYRWESMFENEEEADEVQYCPMCGTANTTQI